MDYKKTNAPLNTVTRDMISMAEQTGNVYETVLHHRQKSQPDFSGNEKELDKKLPGVRLDRQPRGGVGKPRADRDFTLL